MKALITLLWLIFGISLGSQAAVKIDFAHFGQALGGWNAKDQQHAEYDISGSRYRTYKPEITPTPDGGIFVSVRIDHIRGWMASDDHASLELTIDAEGQLQSAQSKVAIQGRSISSDLIRSGTQAGSEITGVGGAVKVGTDLVANLSAKLLREKFVEAGRVSFPAVIRHNYNQLYQAIRIGQAARPAEIVEVPADADKPVEKPAPPCDTPQFPTVAPYKPEPTQKP